MHRFFFIILAACLLPDTARAHILSSDAGFLSGLTHPVLGFDHFLAMLSVGILSAQIGGRAIWTVPLTFVVVMAAGALTGVLKIPLPGVEYGIALSLLVLGTALAAGRRIVPGLAMVCVAVFAVFHGHAHGNEIPKIVNPAVYALGFLLGTAGIHLAGVFIGVISGRTVKGTEFLRFIGAGIAGIGVHIIYILAKY